MGSWPEPPPETIPTLPCTGASARTMYGRVVADPDQVGVRRGDALERLPHHVLDPVDELLHPYSSSTTSPRVSTPVVVLAILAFRT